MIILQGVLDIDKPFVEWSSAAQDASGDSRVVPKAGF